jgi:hypothetical protein
MRGSREVALWSSIVVIALLAFLTFYVIVAEGFDWIVVMALVILVFLGVGVIGALTQPPNE